MSPTSKFDALLPVLRSSLLTACLLTLSAGVHADIGATHESLVSEFASFNTPGTVDGRVEAIAIDGDTVFVGGTFTQIHEPLSDEIIDQPYLFAYSKSTGNLIRDFDPVLNNTVYALETTGEGTGIFAGGVFNILNGESNLRGLVKINNSGDRQLGFVARPNALVTSMVRLDNTLYLGGNFTQINNLPIEHLAALNTTTGDVSPNLNLDFDGRIFTTVTPNSVQGVDDIDITSDGRLMVIIGNFQSIDGISRTRLATIELEGQAKVSTWNTDVYDVQCPVLRLPQYIRGIDIAPDNSYVVVGSQGFRRVAEPACDTIVRFELEDLTNNDVQPTWVNYTGGDSVYEVVATDHAIYVGGHFRWLTNDATDRGDRAGPGSVERAGLGALDPLNGLVLLNWQSDRNPRGVGTFALIAEPEGIYIGDDTDFLNGSEHQKLKFLPISTNTINRPGKPSLPTTIVSANDNALNGNTFDGTIFGAPMALLDSGWGDSRGAMFVGGQLFHADDNSNLWMSQFRDGTFEPRVPVDLFGLTNNEWRISQMGGMFFDYDQGRAYYTIQNDSRLFWRGFTPDSPFFGNDTFVAEQQGDILWGDVSGMDVINNHLYFGRTNGSLYRAEINRSAVIAGTTEEISGPGIDGRNWNNTSLAFLSEGMLLTPRAGTQAQFEFESSGSQASRRFQTFEFPVTPGEPTVLRLAWDDPNAMLRLFVRDANNNPVASDATADGSPKFLTVPAGDGGTYSASVLIAEGATSFSLQVNPIQGPPPPAEPLADFEFSASGTATNGSWQVFSFDVEAGELVEAQVIWDDPSAAVNVFLRNENRTAVDRDTDGSGSPGLVSAVATTSGQWSVAVKINSGAINYDVLVNTTSGGVLPEPTADFEFSANGTATNGSWQVFRFPVVAGETVDAQVIWDNPSAAVNVFLRDQTGAQVDREIDGNGSGTVSAVAASSGQWSVAVKINSGAVSYDVQVNTN